jgi:hypothetical protein
MNLKKKIGKVFMSKFVGIRPLSHEKRIYRAAVSQRLRNTARALTGYQKRSTLAFLESGTHMTIQLLEYQIVLILMLSSYRSCFVTAPIFALNNKSEGVFHMHIPFIC